MIAKKPSPSTQMLAVLQLLECEGSMTARQINDRLYQSASFQSRRAFAASMSRTIRRMERHGLISREGGTIAITEHGTFTLHPERLEAIVQEFSTGIGESVRKAIADVLAMPEYRWLNPH